MAKSRFILDAILSVKLSNKFQVRLVTDDMGEEIESEFFKKLDIADKKRYKEKLSSKLGLRTDPMLTNGLLVEMFGQVLNFRTFVSIC